MRTPCQRRWNGQRWVPAFCPPEDDVSELGERVAVDLDEEHSLLAGVRIAMRVLDAQVAAIDKHVSA